MPDDNTQSCCICRSPSDYVIRIEYRGLQDGYQSTTHMHQPYAYCAYHFVKAAEAQHRWTVEQFTSR